MVEAAIIFPVVILTAITLLYLTISVYMEAETVSRFHIEMRRAAGAYSGTWQDYDKANDKESTLGSQVFDENYLVDLNDSYSFMAGQMNITEKGYLIGRYLEGQVTTYSKGKGIITIYKSKDHKSKEGIINEEVYVRWIDGGKRVLLPYL